jgi:P-type Na+/K+ transporter
MDFVFQAMWVDTSFYGGLVGALSLANFVVVAYLDGPGVAHTSNCNGQLNDTCRHVFRARSAAFGTMTLLLLLHAYNCKDLAVSITRMTLLDNRALLWSVLAGVLTLIPTFYTPVVYDKVFYQAPIDWEWGIILGAAVVFVLLSEAFKCVRPTLLGKTADPTKGRVAVVDAGGIELVVHTA